jgi:AcrR family transcriptional regulator
VTVRDWIPVPGTTKGRLVEAAVAEFARRDYDEVGVTEIAAAAGVTVGSLYHHFGSKAGLYDLVRDDVERRLLDRLEGAWDAAPDLGRTLGIGFDYLTRVGFARLLATPHPDRASDPVERFLADRLDTGGLPVGRLLAATWRAALLAALDDPEAARAALGALVPGV